MKTIQLPPVIPFGDVSLDGLQIDLVSFTVNLFPLTDKNDLFLRVTAYSDGDLTYFVGGRSAIQDDVLDRLEGFEDIPLSEENAALLRKWKLSRLLKHLA